MSSSPSNSPSGSQASPSGATTAATREGAPPAQPLTKLAGGPTPRAAASAAAAAAPSDSPSHVPCSITAKQWDTVAVWSWDVQTKVCAICKGNLADQCISCQAQGSATEKPAPAAHGSAGVAGAAMGGARGPASVGVGGSVTGASATASASAAPAAAARRSAGGLAQGPGPANTTAAAKHSTPATLADLSDKCCVAWGTCGHVFHYHCVSRWLQMRSMCPVCGRPWQLHKITSNE